VLLSTFQQFIIESLKPGYCATEQARKTTRRWLTGCARKGVSGAERRPISGEQCRLALRAAGRSEDHAREHEWVAAVFTEAHPTRP